MRMRVVRTSVLRRRGGGDSEGFIALQGRRCTDGAKFGVESIGAKFRLPLVQGLGVAVDPKAENFTKFPNANGLGGVPRAQFLRNLHGL